MRIRGSHVATLILAIIVGLVILVIWRDRSIAGDGVNTAVEDARVPGLDDGLDNVPIIELETYDYHMGTVPNTGFTFGEVKVFNKGKSDLHIKDIQTTCACTVGRIEKKYNPIPPGGVGILSIRIDPRRIPGFNSRKTLTIQSSDAIHPNVKLQVEVDVEPEYALIPEEINMGSMVKGDGTTASLILRQLRDEPIGITEVKEHLPEEAPQDEPMIEFSFEKLPEDQWKVPSKEEYRITARQGPLIPAGPFEQRFRIISSIDRAAEYIPVRGVVTTPYTIDTGTPGFVFLGGGRADAPLEARVTVTSASPLELVSVTTDRSRILAEATQPGPAERVVIDVKAAMGVPSGQLLEYLYFTLRLDGKEYRERLAVRAVIP